jgi:ABC-type multidrug transport system fused ATPase/permease subunit
MAADAKETTGVKVLFRSSVWRIGLLLLAFAGLVIVLLPPLQGIAVPHFRAARQTSAELASFLEERFSSIEDIQYERKERIE